MPKLGARAAYAKQAIRDKLIEHREYIGRHGDDMPEISELDMGTAGSVKNGRSTAADNVLSATAVDNSRR